MLLVFSIKEIILTRVFQFVSNNLKEHSSILTGWHSKVDLFAIMIFLGKEKRALKYEFSLMFICY